VLPGTQITHMRSQTLYYVPDRRNFVIDTSAMMAEADAYATKSSLKGVEDSSESRKRQVEVCKV
jgi:hypothetical protein